MAIEQRALIIRASATSAEGLAELNVELQRGWRVAHVTPMGGTGLGEEDDAPTPFLAALVIIERSSDEEEGPVAVEALEKVREVEDEPQEIAEEVVEENGAGSPLKS